MRKFNWVKKLLGAVLAAAMVFGLAPITEMAARAVTFTGIDDFDSYIYRADIWTDASNGGTPQYRSIQNYTGTFITPAQILVNELSASAGFMSGVAAWETLTFNPKEIVGDMLDEKGFYEAIIFSVLNTQSADFEFLSSQNKEIAENVLTVGKSVADVMKQFQIADWDGFTKSSDAALDHLVESVNSKLLSYTWHGKLGKISGFMKDWIGRASSITEWVNNVAQYQQLLSYSAEVVEAIGYLYDACPASSTAMKAALLEAKTVMSGAFGATLIDEADLVLRIGEVAYDEIVGDVWSAILSENPFFAGLLIGQAIGKFIANGLFSTDATIEQFYKMRALTEFESLVRTSINPLAATYRANPDSLSARTFIKVIDIMFSTFDLGCDYAEQFADIVYKDALLNAIPKQTYDDLMAVVADNRKYTQQNYDSLLTSWVFNLEEDYPDIYAVLFPKGNDEQNNGNGYGSNGAFLAPIGAPDPNATKIYTAQDLYDVRSKLNGSYVLMNDIDLSGFNDGEWVPIGDSDYQFTGKFDGQGHTIRNMRITKIAYDTNIGLFGSVTNATIRNVGLTLGYIDVSNSSGVINAGGLVGYASPLTLTIIENCYNTGNISISSMSQPCAAGIIGFFHSSLSSLIIKGCYNTGNINISISPYTSQAGGKGGGIVGCALSDVTIENCYNAGTISTSYSGSDMGGIVGYAASILILKNCYNTGNVAAHANSYFGSMSGGIVGRLVLYAAEIENCYNAGNVSVSHNDTGYEGYMGGIIGYNGSGASCSVKNCYYISSNSGAAGNNTSISLTHVFSLNAPLMRIASSYAGFDFDTVWGISQNINGGYPYLRALTPNADDGTTNWDFIVPEGYVGIYTPQDLDDVRNNLGGKYILMNDIDLGIWGNWVPIGTGKTNAFTGTFDGRGYKIRNLTINTSTSCGLFGDVEYATIKNIGMVDANITGSNTFAGGIAGTIYYSSIDNCYNTGIVSCSPDYPNSTNRYAGGIVGIADYSSISNCYNTGNISAATNWGYTAYAGGIAGDVGTANIENCYNIGNISSEYMGGIVGAGGSTDSSLSIMNCYYLNNTSSAIGRNKGIITNVIPLTSAQMQDQSSFVGFDFDTIWGIFPNINNGYPYLRALGSSVDDSGSDNNTPSPDALVVNSITGRDSTTYYQDLSIICAELSSAAYSENGVTAVLQGLGFDEKDIETHNYYDFPNLNYALNDTAHAFAKKQVDGKTVVAVVIRGTSGVADWISNINTGYDVISGKHNGFNIAMYNVCSDLITFLGGLPSDGNTKYLITGHSRGAAAANLLAVQLSDMGVSSADVFDYNYAVPDAVVGAALGSKWNPDGAYDNIFNICNGADTVPYVPGSLGGVITPPGFKWGKFGRTYWFSTSSRNITGFDAHDMGHYINFVTNSASPGDSVNPDLDFWKFSLAVVTTVLCPVDVQVYDDGTLVASIVDNEVAYYDSVPEDLIIITFDDKKAIVSLSGKQYDFSLTATDAGTMEFAVSVMNIATGEIEEQKEFIDIALYDGKHMSSASGGDIETPDVELLLLNDDLEKIGEVLENGTEVMLEKDPSDTEDPTETEGSTETDDPIETDDPAETEEPDDTEEPADTDESGDTENSTETDTPTEEDESEDTQTPDNTSTPPPSYNVPSSIAPSKSSSTPTAPDTEITAPRASDPELPFTDINKSDWFYDDAQFVYARGLFRGTTATTFSPTVNMTRAMLVTVLHRLAVGDAALGVPNSNATDFADVPPGQWYSDAIAWAANLGIITGIGDNKFAPNTEITRQDLAVLLYRYAGSPTSAASLSAFPDAEAVSDYARDALAWAIASGIIRGDDSGKIDPKSSATRADAAA
ncbi:MAG: S-layer homology domain-containing protein, partial [Oscillospiraceae bacterium]|nr:S-layer homology domain-containing protein [Oscillospiraceae bacterium]